MRGVKVFAGAAASALLLFCMGPTPVLADTIEAALVRAYQNNPQLNSQRAQVRITDENVPQALSGYRPKVNVTASAGYQYSDSLTNTGDLNVGRSPPINGANAFSGTPYFTAAPGDPYKAWDVQTTFDFMPSQFVTFRAEYNHRAANVPYFAGEGGVTPPGGNQGPAGSVVPDFTPDLRKDENRLTFAFLLKL